jgi:myo-inositol 2-dehydrogenase/D-chiro-inositol 1-dehydrogenase
MTVRRRIGVGVVGFGWLGQAHSRSLLRIPTLFHDRTYEPRLVACSDALPARVDDAVTSYGFARGSVDWRAVVEDPEVEAVWIAAPNMLHGELVAAVAAAGKAVFCEKPVSLELSELERALAAIETAGVPFQIGFNRRFDPAHAAVREAVASGAVGDPHLVRISSRDPEPPPLEYVKTSGGLFLDMMIHDFDMARYVTGSEVVEVFARGAVRVDPMFEQAGDIDTALVTLVHEDGCLTAIDNSRRAAYGYDQRVEVFGSGGMAVSDNPLAHTTRVLTDTGVRCAPLPYFFLERYMPSYVREWEAFVSAVQTGTPPPVSVNDARAPLLIGMAAWQSLHGGRPVRIDRNGEQ